MVLLLVLGCGLTGASLIALWTRATVLNTDRYVDTMAPIAAARPCRRRWPTSSTRKITGAIDFDALARDVLPSRADVLAPAIAAGAESAIREAARPLRRLRSLPGAVGRGQPAGALRASSACSRRASPGDSRSTGNTVYLDLSAAVDRLKERLSERGFTRIADAIPATVDGRIPLLTSDGFAPRARAST